MKKENKINLEIPLLVLCLFGLFLISVILLKGAEVVFIPQPKITPILPISGETKGIKKFASEEDFKNYLKEGKTLSEEFIYSPVFRKSTTLKLQGVVPAPMVETPLEFDRGGGMPDRVSETTVQVPGIDEPDILKTDGKKIYFSQGRSWPVWRGPIIMEEKIVPPYYKKAEIKIIKAFPPTELKEESKIEQWGDLLLIKEKSILTVFSGQKIFGYNISNPKKPEKKWEIELNQKNSVVTSRLYKNKIYLITKNYIDEIHPCPIKPFLSSEKPIEITCSEIYYPSQIIPVDVIFLAMVIDPSSGEIEKKISFVGSSSQAVVYMSENAIYVTYTFYESIVKFISDFLKTKCKDIVSSWIIEKLDKIESYDISQEAKILELGRIFDKYLNSLENDERLKIENELENRMSDYYKEKMRELEKSGIVKIGLENLEIKATGQVPGFPLNQFALDEYQGNLRVAITVGERTGFFGRFGGQRSSANDVYVLDKNLNIVGSVKDMGLEERIYSVRFIEDKGYVVTFRETDPFYVLDLKVPTSPQLKGELKIPGYSAYLHPITKDKILGMGKENWQVKISLFDVTDPGNPKEKDKYILDESWSDILNTHHAFLLDEKHQIFFLPGSKGGYIFSYKNDKLVLIKAVSQISAKRAIYIEDYLYIIGDNKIIVLDENSWEKIKELEI